MRVSSFRVVTKRRRTVDFSFIVRGTPLRGNLETHQLHMQREGSKVFDDGAVDMVDTLCIIFSNSPKRRLTQNGPSVESEDRPVRRPVLYEVKVVAVAVLPTGDDVSAG